MKLIDFVKKACKEKGIDPKHAARIIKAFKLEKEEDVDAAIDTFKDDILPAITEAEEDAKKAAKEELEKAAKEAKPDEETKPDLTGLSPELQAVFVAQNKQISDLTTLITGLATSQSKSQKLEMVRTKMKGKVDDDFLEDFAGRVNLDAKNLDTEIEAQITNYSKFEQKFINKAVSEGSYRPASGAVSDTDFDSFLKTKSESAPAFKGAEI